jgi:uncharacterized protein involved in exopolysaccharide biosynthesis
MKVRALDESGRNIDYLREQLRKTDSVHLQEAISRLLEVEMQKVMLAQGADQYSFRVIDEAQPPVRRERPKRTIIVLFALVGSFFLAALLAIALDPLRASMAPK